MKTIFSKMSALSLVAALALSGGQALAQSEAKTLDELLQFVKQGKASADRENKKREAEFIAAKGQQAKAVEQAKASLAAEEARSARLEKTFDENKEKIIVKREALNQAKGSLVELFGHITSAAGDMQAIFDTSLVSLHYPNRGDFLAELIEKLKGDALPSIEEIERVWFELQREAVESGKVVIFDSTVATPAGESLATKVVRVGTFNVVTADGQYLEYTNDGSLAILPRQPAGQFTGWAAELASASGGASRFGVDPTGPSGGSLLKAFINSPSIEERWHQGGTVGYIISAVGAVAMLIAIWRLIVLTVVGGKVSSQLKSGKANTNNPLGRVLAVSEENPNLDSETLELKLNEAVLKEIPKLENSLTLLKIIAAVAPLLGLLGTVTGMIITFQAITIFGAGDPKAMAGGISSALVTTVLGLVVAIPTLLLHTIVNGRAKGVIHVLEEQAAGIIARNTESK